MTTCNEVPDQLKGGTIERGPVSITNGAYNPRGICGIYPVNCSNPDVEPCELPDCPKP
jgi:hypothetical protein